MIRQVSSTLISPTEKLKVQLTVGLVDMQNNPSYCSMYNNGNTQYLNISPNAYIVIKYVEKGKPWSKTDSVYITPRNIFSFKTDLELFYKFLMDNSERLYAYGSNGYIISMGDTKPFERVIPLGNGQMILLEPTTIYDSTGKPLPGIYMYINVKSNMIELSMEEFESFYYLFQTINIHQESILLLQTYIIMCLRNGGLKIPTEKSGNQSYTMTDKNVEINMFERASMKNEAKEMVSGPPIQKTNNFKLEDFT